jgi:hypothetical protein
VCCWRQRERERAMIVAENQVQTLITGIIMICMHPLKVTSFVAETNEAVCDNSHDVAESEHIELLSTEKFLKNTKNALELSIFVRKSIFIFHGWARFHTNFKNKFEK